MRVIVALALAYFAAAVFYVWRDLSERNIVRMKPYAMAYRRTGKTSSLLLHGLGWIVGVTVNASMRGRLSNYEVGPIAVFFVAAVVAYWISN